MKIKSIMAAGIVALAGAITASAATTVTFTGSTAFRAQTHAGIQASLAAGYTLKFTGTTLSTANAAVFVGNVTGAPAGANPYTIHCSWAGSSGGIQTVAASAPTYTVGTLDPNAAPVAAVLPGTSGATDPRNPKINPIRPDIAMGDTAQSATVFNGTVTASPGVPAGVYLALLNAKYNGVDRGPVGVIPFQWVGSTSCPAGLNMTPNIAQAIYTTIGAAPLALFTGLNADQGTTVYGCGRDPDSGTRAVAYAESGIGATNTSVQQYQTLPTTAGGAISSMFLATASTINGYSFATGVGGESSGGTLANKMRNTGPTGATPGADYGAGFLVAYMGINDVVTLLTGASAGKTLKWNGVDYSELAVREGQYTFWSYQRLLHRPSLSTENDAKGLGSDKVFLADKIASTIYNATSTVNITDMQVSRPTDGGLVTATYF